MPSHTAYPDANDVERVLRSTGLFDSTTLASIILDLDLETLAAAASQQWERETGWRPFLADASDVTRYFDPGGPNFRPQVVGGGYLLDPMTGIFSVTSIHTGWSETDAGTALTVNTDYRLTPYNQAVLSPRPPYMGIQLTVPSWGLRHSVRVIGRFGYSSTVPDDAWLAIGHQAVRLALPEIAVRISGGSTEFQELGVTERFPSGFLTGKDTIGERWATEWRDTRDRYRRIVL